MPSTLETVVQQVRVKLDQSRETDNSKKFAKTLSINIYADDGNGNRIGVVIAESGIEPFETATVVVKEEEVPTINVDDRVAAAIASFDLKTV